MIYDCLYEIRILDRVVNAIWYFQTQVNEVRLLNLNGNVVTLKTLPSVFGSSNYCRLKLCMNISLLYRTTRWGFMLKYSYENNSSDFGHTPITSCVYKRGVAYYIN